jgi:hypothetical protein
MAIAEEEKSTILKIMPIVYLTGVVLTVVTSYLMINMSFKHFSTVYVIPQLKAGNIFHNLLSGCILLREFGEYTFINFMVFLTGITI